MPPTALIAFGSNLGNPRSSIKEAIRRLSGMVSVGRVSSLYSTKAVGGPPAQPDFLNGALTIVPEGSPRETLEMLLGIEKEMGRAQRQLWGPRIIDLDLLAQDDIVVNEPSLKVPHPRLHERAFVLAPLAEIAPRWRHPLLNLTAGEMLDRLNDADRAVILGREEAFSREAIS